jgi:beta-D-xylosidase 4
MPFPPATPFSAPARTVTSDCDADGDVFFQHNYTRTPEEAVQVILRAGTDVDCGKFMTTYAPTALSGGQITQADIDTVLTRLFRVRIRLAQFDPPGVLATIGLDQVCSDYARELARDGVRQSAVLLKNDRATLPLNSANVKSVVVIGPALK